MNNSACNMSNFELQMSYLRMSKSERAIRLLDILDSMDFNHVIIFVRSPEHCMELEQLLKDQEFPAIGIHGQLSKEETMARNKQLKESKKHKSVKSSNNPYCGTDNMNIILNYDMPADTSTYLQQLAGAFKLGPKCLSIAFVTDDEDMEILNKVQTILKVNIQEFTSELLP